MSQVALGTKLVFISHRWLRPWHTQKECESNRHLWAGNPHPDDADRSKYQLICASIPKLVEKFGWHISQVCLWLDFCCIEQDCPLLLRRGVESLRGYISLCNVILIPSQEVPSDSERTVDKIGGDYGKRAWTRLESMSFYAVSCFTVLV